MISAALNFHLLYSPPSAGPWPHTRYVAGYPWSTGNGPWTMDLSAAVNGPGTPIQASDSLHIIDDDLVGHVSVGGAFCLDFVTNGMLEVWVGGLSGNRFAVALFNRSPASDVITLQWSHLGVPDSARFAIRDVWAAANKGVFAGSYTATVEAHAAAFLILTPQ